MRSYRPPSERIREAGAAARLGRPRETKRHPRAEPVTEKLGHNPRGTDREKNILRSVNNSFFLTAKYQAPEEQILTQFTRVFGQFLNRVPRAT